MEIMMRRKTDTMIKSRKNKILAIFSYGTLILAFGFVALIIFWGVYPYKTIKVNNVSILTPTVQHGGDLAIKLDYDRYTDVDSAIIREFKDGIVFTTPEVEATGDVGHYDRLVEVSIPDTLPPGDYTLTTTATFKVNSIRKISVEWTTSSFKVTSNKETQ